MEGLGQMCLGKGPIIDGIWPWGRWSNQEEYERGSRQTCNHRDTQLFCIAGTTRIYSSNIILGYPWLWQHNPEISWQTQEVKLSCCPNCCAKTSRVTHQEQKAHPQSKGPQIPSKPPYYPDPGEDDPDDPEDDSEVLVMEPSKPGGSVDEVKEGDCIFITMYMPLEAIGMTSTISQRITEESVKDNRKSHFTTWCPPTSGATWMSSRRNPSTLYPNAAPGIM